ncbi:MAG: polyisoprenoid-binding protein YceI [Saprospiraceae bacterium]|jgi:polyisoprenoid-binding protein YceI
MNIYITLIIAFFLGSLSAQTGQLIVFVQQDRDTFFINNYLNEVIKIADETDCEFILRDASKGVPGGITTTPAIVHQNHLGRSLYAARYAELNTIKNFIRTARSIPQKKGLLPKENTLVYKEGRASIAAPIKITELGGAIPKGFDQKAFKSKAVEAISESMTEFRTAKKMDLMRSDRQFYMDFYPHVEQDGNLYLSLALFSQFNCIVPIFKQFDTPLIGKIEDYFCLFEKGAKILQEKILEQLRSSKIGDAYSPVPVNITMPTWENLKLALPQNLENEAVNNTDLTLRTGDWTVEGVIDNQTPLIQFRFAEPLERYAGEVQKMSGKMTIDENGKITAGDFVVPVKSLTMGIESFDAKIFKSYLKASRFPNANFTFQDIGVHESLSFGQTTQVTINGLFKLKNKKKIIPARAQITPIADADGNARLSVNASFQLNITDDFGIEGPDGPAPNRKLMEFNMNFLLQ